jgi:hypothetical protein
VPLRRRGRAGTPRCRGCRAARQQGGSRESAGDPGPGPSTGHRENLSAGPPSAAGPSRRQRSWPARGRHPGSTHNLGQGRKLRIPHRRGRGRISVSEAGEIAVAGVAEIGDTALRRPPPPGGLAQPGAAAAPLAPGRGGRAGRAARARGRLRPPGRQAGRDRRGRRRPGLGQLQLRGRLHRAAQSRRRAAPLRLERLLQRALPGRRARPRRPPVPDRPRAAVLPAVRAGHQGRPGGAEDRQGARGRRARQAGRLLQAAHRALRAPAGCSCPASAATARRAPAAWRCSATTRSR